MTEKNYKLPYGLAINGFYNRMQNKWISRAKRHLFRSGKDYYYFNYDINKNMLFPYVGRALKHYLETTNSRTIISTTLLICLSSSFRLITLYLSLL